MEYIIYDLEATCWEGNRVGRIQEIIEIGAVHVDAYGVAGNTFEKFVRPLHEPMLSVYCRQLTHIEQEDIDAARSFGSVGQEFVDWIEAQTEGEYLLCSWGAKDKELLQRACLDYSMETDWLDQCRDLKEDYHQFKRMSSRIGLKKALLREGVEFDGAHHRALDDAKNLTTLFLKHFDMWAQ